jgi:hypothetical protein
MPTNEGLLEPDHLEKTDIFTMGYIEGGGSFEFKKTI